MQRNLRVVRSRRKSISGPSSNNGLQDNKVEKVNKTSLKLADGVNMEENNYQAKSIDMIKPFLLDLLRSNKPFKRINSRFGRFENQTDTDALFSQIQMPHEFKDAVLAKFRKSDKFSLSLFKTIGILDQEIKNLKAILSQAAQSKSHENVSIPKKSFAIDLMTEKIVSELETIGITAQFTSPAYIYILDDPEQMNLILQTVRIISRSVEGGLRVVGLDAETGPRHHHSSFPSIIQVAINKNIVIIFQVIILFK